MNNTPEKILEFLRSDGELLVVTHFSPDGDAVGSLISFDGMLNQLNIKHELGIDDEIPDKYSFLKGFDRICNLSQQGEKKLFEKVVILDAGALPRIGTARQCIGPGTRILNIDHHFTGPYYGDINLVKVEAAATAEILYDLCNELGIEIDQQIAYGLFVGILTDTGRFRFANTSARALDICSELVLKGVDPGWVTENVYYNMPIENVRSLAQTLSTIEIHYEGLVCLINFDPDGDVVDTEGFVEYASSIRGVALAAFIRRMEERHYKVSLRSRCKIDVAEVARKFGGGGHLKAAGFRYRGGIEDLKKNLLEEFEWHLKIHKIKPGASFMLQVPHAGNEY